MTAPLPGLAPTVRRARLELADERARIAAFLAARASSTPFHSLDWLDAVERATGHETHVLLSEEGDDIVGLLPLHAVRSPLFGSVLVSTGFAVGGGIVADTPRAITLLAAAAEELAGRLACPTIELRGGVLPHRAGWEAMTGAHAGFSAPLAADAEAQLLAIPRKQRAEVRKGLANGLEVRVGHDSRDRAEHYAVYAESVRNLGTPVFPRGLFEAVLDRFGDAADILTVSRDGAPLASVISLYHRGVVMPYWGGGTGEARATRANDLMYYALTNHARTRGCDRFDFGRSKVGSGAWHFKRNWGFEPLPLEYSRWSAPGAPARDVDPNSPRHAARIAAWKRLPLGLANRLGPLIARGLA